MNSSSGGAFGPLLVGFITDSLVSYSSESSGSGDINC